MRVIEVKPTMHRDAYEVYAPGIGTFEFYRTAPNRVYARYAYGADFTVSETFKSFDSALRALARVARPMAVLPYKTRAQLLAADRV